jgi:hypothetical protein
LKRLWYALTFSTCEAPAGVLAAQGFQTCARHLGVLEGPLCRPGLGWGGALAQAQVERNWRKAASAAGRLAGSSFVK